MRICADCKHSRSREIYIGMRRGCEYPFPHDIEVDPVSGHISQKDKVVMNDLGETFIANRFLPCEEVNTRGECSFYDDGFWKRVSLFFKKFRKTK